MPIPPPPPCTIGSVEPPAPVPGTAGLSPVQTAAVYRLRLACARFLELETVPPERTLDAPPRHRRRDARVRDGGHHLRGRRAHPRRPRCCAPRVGPRHPRGVAVRAPPPGLAARLRRRLRDCRMAVRCAQPRPDRHRAVGDRAVRAAVAGGAAAPQQGGPAGAGHPLDAGRQSRRPHRLDWLRRLPRPVADPGLRPALTRHVRADRRGRGCAGLRARAARSPRRPLPLRPRPRAARPRQGAGRRRRSISWSPAACSTTCRIAGRWRR